MQEKGFWHKTKEVTGNLWAETKNVTENMWDGTKNMAGNIRDVFSDDEKEKINEKMHYSDAEECADFELEKDIKEKDKHHKIEH